MKICLIGDFSPGMDEGYKNVCHSLSHCLEQAGDHIACLNNKHIRSPAFWKALSDTDAQIFHIFTEPTPRSLLFTALLRLQRPNAKVVISALKPESFFIKPKIAALRQLLLCCARPDLIIIQSRVAADLFAAQGLETACIPNGVDLDRFRPVSAQEKRRLRQQYHLSDDSQIALHVGHLIPERNLLPLGELPQDGVTVIVVASPYSKADPQLANALRRVGIQVWTGYQYNLEQIYQLADFYVFPVLPGNSLSMPLSVLEAMACNLTVLTGPFPALQDYFPEAAGLFYLHPAEELPSMLKKIRSAGAVPRTTALVAGLSWRSVAAQIRARYSQLFPPLVPPPKAPPCPP